MKREAVFGAKRDGGLANARLGCPCSFVGAERAEAALALRQATPLLRPPIVEIHYEMAVVRGLDGGRQQPVARQQLGASAGLFGAAGGDHGELALDICAYLSDLDDFAFVGRLRELEEARQLVVGIAARGHLLGEELDKTREVVVGHVVQLLAEFADGLLCHPSRSLRFFLCLFL